MKIWMVAGCMLLLAACGAAGNESAQTFEFEYGENATVVLAIDTGTLNINPVAGTGVNGTVTTNVGAWSVQQSTLADGVQRVEQGKARNANIPNATNTWDVELGTDQPLTLTIESVSADGNLELGGLQLTGLNIVGTTGNYTLNYNTANPLDDGGNIQVELTNGNLTVNDLINSHVSQIQTRSSGGDQTFDFGAGQLTQDLLGAVESTSGDIVFRIPTGLAARITYTASSGRVLEASPEFNEVNPGVYETAEYADANQARLQFAVRTVAGDLRLVSVPPL